MEGGWHGRAIKSIDGNILTGASVRYQNLFIETMCIVYCNEGSRRPVDGSIDWYGADVEIEYCQ